MDYHRYHQHHHRYTIFCCVAEFLMIFSFHVMALRYVDAAIAVGMTIFVIYTIVSVDFLCRSAALANAVPIRADEYDNPALSKRD